MKRKNKHLTEMQDLADYGWKQMHETLREHGLTSDVKSLSVVSKKKNYFVLIAGFTLLVFILSSPFILNDHSYLSYKSTNKVQKAFSKKLIRIIPLPNKISEKEDLSAGITLQQKRLLHKKINEQYSQFQNENFISALQTRKTLLLKKFAFEKDPKVAIPLSDNKIDTINKIERVHSLQKKSKSAGSKKIQIFAGAGVNVSTAKDHSSSFINNLNVHPGIKIIVPLSQRFSLHTGLWAFSTIHGKEAKAKEKELVNNFGSSFYYNIKTTSIIKASYFDLPLTLHYSINKKWSVGSGLQLSKLYKVNITEQKESFDYNNTLVAASIQQYYSTPSRAIAVFQKKVDIKKFEIRLVAETSFETGKILFSAGYYYGLGKTIVLKDATNTDHHYRNIYFKFGIQYRINGKK